LEKLFISYHICTESWYRLGDWWGISQ